MYNIKLVISGDFLEFYQYEKPVISSYDRKPRKKANTTLKNRAKSSLVRCQNQIRRLINSNFNNYTKTKFITLTFKKEITTISEANLCFKFFLRKFKRYLNFEFKYLAVIEFQKNGRVHYHMLSEIPFFLSNKKLSEIWSYGFVNIRKANDISQVRNLGAYFCKYLTKETFDNEKFFNKKVFQYSRNLKQPLIFDNKVAQNLFNKIKKSMIYEKEFDNDYTGKVRYKQYKIDKDFCKTP